MATATSSLVDDGSPTPESGYPGGGFAVSTDNSSRRKLYSRLFYLLCVLISGLSVVVLGVLLVSIGWQGHSRLNWDLLQNSHSELNPDSAGMWPSIVGSIFICGICAASALPLGIGTAIFLEEFKPSSKPLRMLHSFIQLNISNLAGVPSIVYGLLGLSLFVFMFNVFGRIQVNESSGT
ncbi:MAG: phosphate ABC transporter, permease protein PstA, partial [Rhodopirellula bahusiensis]